MKFLGKMSFLLTFMVALSAQYAYSQSHDCSYNSSSSGHSAEGSNSTKRILSSILNPVSKEKKGKKKRRGRGNK